MTIKEMCEALKGSYEFAKSYPSIINSNGDTKLIVNVDALGEAIKALEKQVPKKHNSGLCPNCESEIDYDLGCGGKFYREYCSDCGQAIDWSEVEE